MELKLWNFLQVSSTLVPVQSRPYYNANEYNTNYRLVKFYIKPVPVPVPIYFEPRWRIRPPPSFSNDSCLVLQYAPHFRTTTLLWTPPFPLYVAKLSFAYLSFSFPPGPMSGL